MLTSTQHCFDVIKLNWTKPLAKIALNPKSFPWPFQGVTLNLSRFVLFRNLSLIHPPTYFKNKLRMCNVYINCFINLIDRVNVMFQGSRRWRQCSTLWILSTNVLSGSESALISWTIVTKTHTASRWQSTSSKVH